MKNGQGKMIGCDHLNNKFLVRYSDGGLNMEPFEDGTAVNHLNTELV